jgi:hypothetical protein
MTNLNSVYASAAVLDDENKTGWSNIIRSAIDAGILDVTRDARKLDSNGNLIGFDAAKLKPQLDIYMQTALPAWLGYAINQLTVALAEAKKVNKKSKESDVKRAQVAAQTAQDRLSVNIDKVRTFVNVSDYGFLTMPSADYKAWQHKDKVMLGKFRDDKRNIMRVQFGRIVKRAWGLADKPKDSTRETYAALLTRFLNGITASMPDGSMKYAEELASRKVSPEILEFAFRLLQDGTLMPQAAKQAAKQSKAISKQAAKQAA